MKCVCVGGGAKHGFKHLTHNESIDDSGNKCSNEALPSLLRRKLDEPGTTKEETYSVCIALPDDITTRNSKEKENLWNSRVSGFRTRT